MNPWDIDPSLYAALWRMLREWYSSRKSVHAVPYVRPKPGRNAGCRA